MYVYHSEPCSGTRAINAAGGYQQPQHYDDQSHKPFDNFSLYYHFRDHYYHHH